MNITRTSPLTGQANTLDLPVTKRGFRRWLEGRACPTLLSPPRCHAA